MHPDTTGRIVRWGCSLCKQINWMCNWLCGNKYSFIKIVLVTSFHLTQSLSCNHGCMYVTNACKTYWAVLTLLYYVILYGDFIWFHYFLSVYLVIHRWLTIFPHSVFMLSMIHKLTSCLCLPFSASSLFFSTSLCVIVWHLLFAFSSNRPIHRPAVCPGRGAGREGGLQWMSIPVVSEVTATQRSYWQQHWTPQFAHAGMCDIVASQSHRNISRRIPKVHTSVFSFFKVVAEHIFCCERFSMRWIQTSKPH